MIDKEGAEYDILDKMCADGTLNRVQILINEWHDRFMPEKKNFHI